LRSFLKKLLSPKLISRIKACQPASFFQKRSYSQCGEDLLIAFVLELMHGKRPMRYVDIGANHPFHISNTALLYAAGGQGVLVEPDPYFAGLLRSKRPRDSILECGVHFSGESHAEFYVMDPPTLNTFSHQEMTRYAAMGHRLNATMQVKLMGINEILEQAGPLDFMNVDVEGLDCAILEKVDWERFRPTCICVETITYETLQEPKKLNDIIELMHKHDYFPYADTFINTIFIDRRQWMSRWDKG